MSSKYDYSTSANTVVVDNFYPIYRTSAKSTADKDAVRVDQNAEEDECADVMLNVLPFVVIFLVGLAFGVSIGLYYNP